MESPEGSKITSVSPLRAVAVEFTPGPAQTSTHNSWRRNVLALQSDKKRDENYPHRPSSPSPAVVNASRQYIKPLSASEPVHTAVSSSPSAVSLLGTAECPNYASARASSSDLPTTLSFPPSATDSSRKHSTTISA